MNPLLMKPVVNEQDEDQALTRAVRDMLESPGYAAYLKRLMAMCANEQERCCQGSSVDQWRHAQGSLAALRNVIELPKRMISEEARQ